jgi:pilus assembly protein Flp/PilA
MFVSRAKKISGPIRNRLACRRKFPMFLVIRFVKDENAATAIEYGLIASGIAVALIPVITGLGIHLKATFSTISSALK